jgi:hypothetical protein
MYGTTLYAKDAQAGQMAQKRSNRCQTPGIATKAVTSRKVTDEVNNDEVVI